MIKNNSVFFLFRFSVVEEMWNTFLKELPSDEAALRAKGINNRGHAKYMQVQFDKAVDDYDEALRLDPDLAVAMYNRATVRFRLGKYREAVEDFEKACEKEPGNEEFKEGLKNCKEKL